MTGQYAHNIDAKGRLFIPAALRRELLETEMQAIVDAARRLGLTREDAHRLLDTLYDREGTDT